MTLVITVSTADGIYQSADFRLTRPDKSRAVVTDASQKLVTLSYAAWSGMVSYAGIGRLGVFDTSERVLEWLAGLENLTPDDVATVIRDRGNRWLGANRYPHTFVLVASGAGNASIHVISNYEDVNGRPLPAGGPLTISKYDEKGRGKVVVSGFARAVTRDIRLRLRWLLSEARDDPARIRQALVDANRVAAASAHSGGTISQGCAVVSFLRNGAGFGNGIGQREVRSLLNGLPMPSVKELTKMIGFPPGELVAQVFSARGGAAAAPGPCKPSIALPPSRTAFQVSEIGTHEYLSCWSVAVSDNGAVIGHGLRRGGAALPEFWGWTIAGGLKPSGMITNARAINASGAVAATTDIPPHQSQGIISDANGMRAVHQYKGVATAVTALSDSGIAAGWVSLDPNDQSQKNWRATVWTEGQLHVLENFADWSMAVDINSAGLALVVAYAGFSVMALRWNYLAGTHEIIGDVQGIYPVSIDEEGTVMGNAHPNGVNEVYLSGLGGGWVQLAAPKGFYACDRNNSGDIVGSVKQEGYERPVYIKESGELLSLPYYRHHHCRPVAMNNFGMVVGNAGTDHGSHALVWTA